jgi:hypothetical protein
MANVRTAWHVPGVASFSEHGVPGFAVFPAPPLSNEPRRADVIVVRRREGPHDDAAAGTLRSFWPLVCHTALIEFKSPTRPLRPGEVARLFSDGGQYHALCFDEIGASENLLLVLVVSSITKALTDELQTLGLTATPIAPGYHRAPGRPYTLLVIDLSTVVEAENDEMMAIFVPNKRLSLAATRFMEQHRMTPDAPKNLAELEEYHEVVQRWLSSLTPAERLEGLAPRERLEGLAPRERLEGLAEEHVVLALSDNALRSMSDEFFRTLPADVQQVIRRRIGRPA